MLDLASLALDQLSEGEAALRCDLHLRQARCLGLRGRPQEERGATEAALAAARLAASPQHLAWATLACSRFRFRAEDYQGARELSQRALEMARNLEMADLEAESLARQAAVALRLGQTQEALAYAAQLEEASRSRDDRRPAALALFFSGCALQELGRFEEARRELESAIPALGASNALATQARAIAQLGITFLHQGSYRDGKVELERSLGVARKIGYVLGALRALLHLGYLALDEGRLDDAQELLKNCLRSCRSRKLRRFEGFALLYLGELARRRGRADEAESLYQEALTLHHTLAASRAIAHSSFALGRHLLEQGDRNAAKPLLAEAAALVDDYSLVHPGQLPLAYLALIGAADPAQIEVSDSSPTAVRAEIHWLLHRMASSGKGQHHLDACEDLLETLSRRLTADQRIGFWRYHPVARAVQRRRRQTSSEVNRRPDGNSTP